MGKPLHILLVEDGETDIVSVLTLLEEAGLITQLEAAKGVEEAFNILKNQECDVVLIDRNLPVGEVLELTRRMRYLEMRMPVIIFDVHKGEQLILDLIRAGASEYLLKGAMKRESLADTVRNSLKVHKLNVASEETLEELQEIEQRFRMLINQSPDAIITYNEEDTIIDWNPRAEELFGWKAHEAIGDPFTEKVLPITDRNLHLDAIKHYLAGENGKSMNVRLEIQCMRKDHSIFPVESVLLPVKVKGKYIFINFIKDQSRIKEQEVALQHTMAHLKETARELQRSNKDLEQFAYIASHDLQEPLRVITSYVQLLKIRFKDKIGEHGNEFVRYILDGTNRMKMLINDLLDYSRVGRQSVNFDQADLNEVFNYAKDNLQQVIIETGTEIHLDGTLPTIDGDSAQLQRLFQNLLSNAIKFRGEKKPEIHVSAFQEEDHWHFVIKDNGIGIREDHLDRIFIIFQRLHNSEDYPGTGIGLAVAKKIVELHGGDIWVKSKIGDGTEFHFTLRGRKMEKPYKPEQMQQVSA